MNQWIKKIFLTGFVAFLFLWPIFSQNPYYLHTAIMVCIMVMMALGLNLLFGYTGQISLAHASYFAIGAYTSTLLEVNTGLSFWLSTPMGILMAALIGIIVGIPTLRLRDHYLALATLSFCMVTQLFLVNTKDLTGGSEGVMGIRNPTFFGYVLKGTPYYFLVLILTLLIFIVIRNLVNSRVGLALETIRENEEAAASLGVNILYYKVMVFALAAGFAALAGSLYAHQALFISPETFGIMLSIEVLIIVVVGGLATNEGAVIGAVAYDVGGFFVGRSAGRSQLAPDVSPGKTYEGLIGGMVLAVLACVVIVGRITPWNSFGDVLLLGVVVAVAAPLGDLCESMLKRNLGIKDMGGILPGHGGLLDRFDTLLFVLPATYYLVRVLDLF